MGAKRKPSAGVVTEGGGLRARLLRQEAIENKDAERARAKKVLSWAMSGMGTREKKLCVYLDDDYFIVGMDELNLTLWLDRSKTRQNPKRLGYFPRLAHLLGAYMEHRINTADSLKVSELVRVVERVEAGIKALDGALIVPAPTGTKD